MSALKLTYLNGEDVAAVGLTDAEILDSVRRVLRAQGRGETVIEPRVHLFPRRAEGHFNVLRGVTPGHAGVKVESWEETVVGADVVVEATRLTSPAPLLKTEWIAPGALVIPYGTIERSWRG